MTAWWRPQHVGIPRNDEGFDHSAVTTSIRLNTSGQVIGRTTGNWGIIDTFNSQGYFGNILTDNVFQQLEPLAGFDRAFGYDMNEDGTVVGVSWKLVGATVYGPNVGMEMQATVWFADPTSPVATGPAYTNPSVGGFPSGPGAWGSQALAINNDGDVVIEVVEGDQYDGTVSPTIYATMYRNNDVIPIVALAVFINEFFTPHFINDLGTVFGLRNDPSDLCSLYLYMYDGTTVSDVLVTDDCSGGDFFQWQGVREDENVGLFLRTNPSTPSRNAVGTVNFVGADTIIEEPLDTPYGTCWSPNRTVLWTHQPQTASLFNGPSITYFAENPTAMPAGVDLPPQSPYIQPAIVWFNDQLPFEDFAAAWTVDGGPIMGTGPDPANPALRGFWAVYPDSAYGIDLSSIFYRAAT